MSALRNLIHGITKGVLVEFTLGDLGQRPTKLYKTDACWDIYSSTTTTVPANSTVEVPTDLCVNIPEGYEGELKLRSGLGREGLDIHHGAYDAGYQGELNPFVHNRTDKAFTFGIGSRVCQFSLRRVIPIRWELVASFALSQRGTKGHGSSGK